MVILSLVEKIGVFVYGKVHFISFTRVITLTYKSGWYADGECSQVIVHPAISVWAVSVMPNGDIVSGSSDSVVRVFSESKERWASEADIKV